MNNKIKIGCMEFTTWELCCVACGFAEYQIIEIKSSEKMSVELG